MLKILSCILFDTCTTHGPGSSVGTATDYGLDGPGSNPGWDEIFRLSRPALGPTPPPVKCVPGFFPGVKCGRGVLLTTHPLLVSRSWKSRAVPLPTLWATPGLWRDHFTFTFTCTKRTALTFVKHVGYFQDTVYHDPSHLNNPIKKCLQFKHLTLSQHVNSNKSNWLCFMLVLLWFADDGPLRTETCRNILCHIII